MSAHTAKSKRTIRADIPADVWDRLSAEAASKGIPLGRLLAALIVARDARRFPETPDPTTDPTTGASTSTRE